MDKTMISYGIIERGRLVDVKPRIRRTGNLDTGDGMSPPLPVLFQHMKGHAFGCKLSFRFEPVLDIVAVYPSSSKEQFICPLRNVIFSY
jgi:hypothetical protein